MAICMSKMNSVQNVALNSVGQRPRGVLHVEGRTGSIEIDFVLSFIECAKYWPKWFEHIV